MAPQKNAMTTVCEGHSPRLKYGILGGQYCIINIKYRNLRLTIPRKVWLLYKLFLPLCCAQYEPTY